MFQAIAKKLAEIWSSSVALIFVAFLIALFAYALEAVRLDGSSVSSRLAYAAYVPFLMWGVFVFLFTGGLIAKKLQERPVARAILLLLWLGIGAWVGYMLSLLGSFVLFVLATRSQYFVWIPVGLPTHAICYSAAVFAATFHALLTSMHFFCGKSGKSKLPL